MDTKSRYENTIYTRNSNRADWLASRAHGIGASEAAAIVGLSPWLTSTQLWRQKVGLERAKDLSGNAAVEQGNRLEPALRGLYAAEHPSITVDYHPFDMLSQRERPWLYATLDGEIVQEDGRKGILEIKTSSCGKKADWEKWNNAIPQNYYTQILHQFLATGFDFAVLYACLFNLDGDKTIRTYEFERSACEADMKWLLEHETEFWQKVERREMPAMILTL